MRVTANDFWSILPIGIARLALHFQYRESFSGWKLEAKPVTVSGRKHPAPGEEIRWIIQSHSDRFVYDPLAVVVWSLTGEYVGLSMKNRGDRVGLDRRFVRRIEDACLQKPGYSRATRKRLLEACDINLQYLEPKTA